MTDVAGILFDMGDTLVYPLGGTWFPGHHFASIVAAHGIDMPDPARLKIGLERGMAYLDVHHFLQTEEEERAQFLRYFSILFEAAGVDHVPQALIQDLAEAKVSEPEWGLYPDTKPVLERLHARGYLLGIVSDTWPSFERRLNNSGLRHLFGPVVISAKAGCSKPGERIFRIAIEESGLNAYQLLFIDNYVENVMAAVGLGMHGVLMDRAGVVPDAPVPVVQTLDQFEALL